MHYEGEWGEENLLQELEFQWKAISLDAKTNIHILVDLHVQIKPFESLQKLCLLFKRVGCRAYNLTSWQD